MMVLGGLVTAVVHLSLSVSIRVGSAIVSLQKDVLDSILRGLLPLTLTLFVWWLLHRQVKPVVAVGVLFLIGIDLTYLGLLGDNELPLFSAQWIEYVIGSRPGTLMTALAQLWPPLVLTSVAVLAFVVWRARQKHESVD
jgi:hypothetical protein